VSQNLYVIAFGTIVGHGLCTGGAVLGGRWLSTKISVKYSTSSLFPNMPTPASPSGSLLQLLTFPFIVCCVASPSVTLIGAVLFLIFSLLYFHEAYVFSLEPGGSLY
jgi:putative Ca2+/H+ antiporter (TMEM165/GDT1 family)